MCSTAWLAVGLVTVGLGALSLRGFSIGYGELVTLVAAIAYAGHIVALGRFSTAENAFTLALVQLITTTSLCTVAAVWPSESSPAGIQLPERASDWLIMVYTAVVAGP